jgi:hypothetical protein
LTNTWIEVPRWHWDIQPVSFPAKKLRTFSNESLSSANRFEGPVPSVHTLFFL